MFVQKNINSLQIYTNILLLTHWKLLLNKYIGWFLGSRLCPLPLLLKKIHYLSKKTMNPLIHIVNL